MPPGRSPDEASVSRRGLRFRLELGPIPFYHQVYLDLRQLIDGGSWTPGHRVPPERELARQYGVSVITVRRALDELAREQRIERTRGRGTFVLPERIDRNLDEPMTFTEEMATRGLDPETRLISARPEPAGESVARQLQLEPGSPTLFLERLRLADGDPLLLEQVHLPAERFPGLLASDLEHQSLYRLLTERYGTQIRRARETFEPVLLRTREAALLGTKARVPALLVEGIAFSDDGSPVEFSRTYVRGDRTRYSVERIVSDEPSRDRTVTPRRPIGALTTVATNRALGGPAAGATREEVEPSRS
jgi:GntR family transcriptional regulator